MGQNALARQVSSDRVAWGKSRLSISIGEIDNEEHLRRCVDLQVQVWGFSAQDVVSASMLECGRRGGGVLLGAFDESATLIGFVFSLPALLGQRIVQHSHMLAVAQVHRGQGAGQQLKRAQYRTTLRRGQPLITWTFEPLESRNAHLNLNKLGAVVRRYYVNVYGEAPSSPLHRGLTTDRLLAEWWVESSSPSPRLRTRSAEALTIPRVVDSLVGPQGWRRPGRPNLALADPVLALEIPYQLQSLKQDVPDLAVAWRQVTRQAFRHYFDQGYLVTELMLVQQDSERRSFYRLERLPPAGGIGSEGR